jgi:hypothetical protein
MLWRATYQQHTGEKTVAETEKANQEEKPINAREAQKRLATLDARLAELKAQRADLLARKRTAEAKAKRGADTRRKILLGSLILSKLDHPELGPRFRAFVTRELDAYLTRADDRAVFPDLLPGEPSGPAAVRQPDHVQQEVSQ